MEEIWKDIKGYENKYQVSNLGKVKIKENITQRMNMGVLRDYKQKEIIMKPSENGCGYLKVGLNKDGNYKNSYVHRLVAAAFLTNEDNLPQVNHIDGDKYNNCVDNLEWCTEKNNSIHARDVLNVVPNTTGIHDIQPVVQIDKDTGAVVKEYNSMTQAQKETGIGHISCVCRGKRKSAGGFFWKYK